MPDPSPCWMIYGANGYTGRLVTDLAVAQGHRPVLAGRSPEVAAIAAARGLTSRVFDLRDPTTVRDTIAGCRVVAHCAGPFSATSRPVIDACLAAGADYVDITGEIDVFEAAWRRDEEARSRGTVICPGVGFDVIPTDCLAAMLADALPGATSLALGFDTASGLSAGTARTTVEALPAGGRIRRAGRLQTMPLGSLTRTIDFGRGPRHATAIPWGDVATAFATTGIPNIEVYVPMPRVAAFMIRCAQPLRRLFAVAGVQRALQALAKRTAGPSATARGTSPTWVWGEARDAAGRTAVARLRTANGYDVTAHGVIMAVEHLLSREGPGGFFTPSRLFGPRCVEQLPGSSAITVEVRGP
jgi:short subunit dehydrogenase-like uncharacterized protein